MDTNRKFLWLALVGLSAGAFLLHFRIHPPSRGPVYLIPNLLALIDLVVVSALYLNRRTAVLGVVLNGFIAFFGIIMMSDFSIAMTLAGKAEVLPSVDFPGWLLRTTLADSAIAFADFAVGLCLYRSMAVQPG